MASLGAIRSLVVCAALAFAGGGGCKTIPEGRSAVGAIEIRGNDAISDGQIVEKIATTESPKFLALFPGLVYEYSLFDRFVLQRDLARIEAYYHGRGYYRARARAGRIRRSAADRVDVEIIVEEGPPVLTRDVIVDGLEGLPRPLADAAAAAARAALPEGAPFEAEQFEKAEGDVRRALTNRGHAHAKVDRIARVDVLDLAADASFVATPGPTCTFGDVRIEGLGPLPEAPVRRAIDIALDQPYSEADLDAAQRAVLDLGVFAAVSVKPELVEPAGEPCVVPVKVVVEPTRLRTITLGGGIEFDALKTDVHGVAGWESRNFLGGMRHFSVRFRPGVVLYPLRVNAIEPVEKLLPEERLQVELRQPGFIEARTNGVIRPELNVYPVLINPNPPENAPVLGYAEVRGAAGVDRRIWNVSNVLSHNVQFAFPFSYVGERDPTLGPLVISYPELFTQLDLRDDRVRPRRGFWAGNTLQFAGGPFGGQADDVKVQPDLRGYVPLSRRVVLAVRGSVGFLVPRSYGEFVRSPGSAFTPSEERTRDYQLTFFRGFFSGGPSSNRGYPLRAVGPHALVPFLSPEIELQRIAASCGDSAGEGCRSPTGGFTLWESSIELRFDVVGPLSFATFCDASDVSPRTWNIRLKHLHLSCGGGVRYDTPVGPIRLDVGYRLPGLQVIGGLTSDEREPRSFVLGIPIAVHVGIGEAY